MKETLEQEIREIARQEAEKLFIEKFSKLNQQDEHVSLKEAKEKYHLFGATLYRKIDNGYLSLIKMGSKAFLLRSEVEKLFVKVK